MKSLNCKHLKDEDIPWGLTLTEVDARGGSEAADVPGGVDSPKQRGFWMLLEAFESIGQVLQGFVTFREALGVAL